MSKSLPSSPKSLALCGLAQAAEMLGDRWTLLILREVFYGVNRFEDMRADIGASKQMLTTRLASLVTQGLLTKHAYRESGSRERYEYVLTEKGRSLGPILVALMEWGHSHILHDEPHFRLTDKRSGQPVHIGFITPQGDEVELTELQLTR